MKESEENYSTIEDMLQAVYAKECVPEDVNVRLRNQLACRKAMGTGRISFWWLPATVSTVVSVAFSIILFTVYIVINIKGANAWMPNLLQLVSETWLKLHLAGLALEIVISWTITFAGIWKANLFRNARML